MHLHHAFLYIFYPSLHDYDMKLPIFTRPLLRSRYTKVSFYWAAIRAKPNQKMEAASSVQEKDENGGRQTVWRSMGLATTLSCALFFLVYLSLLRIRERRNYDTTCKYGLLSRAAYFADDTSSIWWFFDFDRRTSCWHTRWRRFYFGLNSPSLVSILVCGDISSSPVLYWCQGGPAYLFCISMHACW